MQRHMLKTSYRTKDSKLLTFLKAIRTMQPDRSIVTEFFTGRRLGNDLISAVKKTLAIQSTTKQLFTWLTVSERKLEQPIRIDDSKPMLQLGMSNSNEKDCTVGSSVHV